MTEAIQLSVNSWYGLGQETNGSQDTTTTSSTSFSDTLVHQLSATQASGQTSEAVATSASAESAAPTDNYYGYLLTEWQVMHPEAQDLLDSHDGLADFLAANPDYADMFTNAGGEGIEQALNAYLGQSGETSVTEGEETTAQESVTPTDNAYAFTLDDWQAAHPGAMELFGDLPGLPEFLANNPGYGSKFVNDGILGSSEAVAAYLAQLSETSSSVSATA